MKEMVLGEAAVPFATPFAGILGNMRGTPFVVHRDEKNNKELQGAFRICREQAKRNGIENLSREEFDKLIHEK